MIDKGLHDGRFRNRGLKTWSVLAVLAALLPPAFTGEPAELAATAPDAVLLFKSGQAWLQRNVSLDPDADFARVALPASVHGTIWLGAEGIKVDRAIARFEPHTEEMPIVVIADLLRRAVGSRVTLRLGEDEQLDCRVVRLLEEEDEIQPMPRGSVIPRPVEPTHVAVEAGGRVTVLAISRIWMVELAEADTGDWTFDSQNQRPVLEVEWSRSGGSEPRLDLYNMAGGLAWSPSYLLELGENARSTLSGKAVVINDLEDLEETQVKLVIGFPNIKFSGTDSPLAPSVSLEAWANMLRGASYESSRSLAPVMMQQMRAPEAPARLSIGAGGPELEGEATEDLFIYDAGKMTLAKGERAYVSLSSETVEHEHRFDWTLPDTVKNNRFMDTSQVPTPPVWHVLELANGSTAPWTTAPILVLGPHGPIAQSQLGYTPGGGDAVVALTQAMDIVGRTRELRADEAQTQRETVKLFGHHYERVQVRGQLELDNRSRRSVPMHVVKEISGDVLSAEGEPKIDARAAALNEVNASRTLTWEFELEAGASWKAEYTYEVLIRR